MPPPGQDDSHRRDGLGDAQYHRVGQSDLLGHVGMVGGGDRASHRDRGASSPA
ncbi:MAG: hypothetical protein MZV64_19775 [Ignavibacteriales bacterium]|nr:hypothetical protein [Ignavibacteriales bacterium]